MASHHESSGGTKLDRVMTTTTLPIVHDLEEEVMTCSNLFKCCFKSPSRPLDNRYNKSSDSIDNVSMITVTYGLESFNKNALLIFCQVTSEQGSRDRELASKEVEVIKNAFQKYRFEVEIHVDLTSHEIEEKSNQFFARDFTEYGAVAVVIMARYGESGTLLARDKSFHESVIVKYLTTDVPESLKGKPKIYITEANRTSTPAGGNVLHSLRIEDLYEDVLGLHIPSVMEGTHRSPLQIFCDRMKNAEDHGNLIGIVIGSIHEIEENFPALKEKIELTCTFKKRFTLPIFILLA